jgi:hypothetical protein
MSVLNFAVAGTLFEAPLLMYILPTNEFVQGVVAIIIAGVGTLNKYW